MEATTVVRFEGVHKRGQKQWVFAAAAPVVAC